VTPEPTGPERGEPRTSEGDTKLENLAALLIDGERVEFLAAAIDRPAQVAERGAEPVIWSLLVSEASTPLPHGEMDVIAVTEAGSIYAGRGRWKDQRVSPERRLHTDLVQGVEDLRVGSVSELEGDDSE